VPGAGVTFRSGHACGCAADRGEIYKAGEGRHIGAVRVAAAVPAPGPSSRRTRAATTIRTASASHASGARGATTLREEWSMGIPKPARPGDRSRPPILGNRRAGAIPSAGYRAAMSPRIGYCGGSARAPPGALCFWPGRLVEIRSSRGAGTSVTLRSHSHLLAGGSGSPP